MTVREKHRKNIESLRDRAYAAIKHAIVTAQLLPDERIVEETMAARLGISRTPVREALQRLEKEGLVFRHPRRGFAAVKGATEEEVADIMDLQRVLEGYVTRLAASRITDDEIRSLNGLIFRQEGCLSDADVRTFIRLDGEFHDTIHRAAKNGRLYDLMLGFRDYMDRYRMTVFRAHANLHLSIKDHKEIVGMMRARNADEIERLIDKHMIRANNFIKKKIRWERNRAAAPDPAWSWAS